MRTSRYLRFLIFVGCLAVLVMCKSQEQLSHSSSALKCEQLIETSSQDSLYFVGKAESTTEKMTTKRAEKEATNQLMQFFQTEIIEAEQFVIFTTTGESASWGPPELEKEWSEVSHEMISSMHDRGLFTHKKDINKSNNGTISVIDVLIISDNWIKEHWDKSLSATDSEWYLKAKANKMYEDLKEMDIEQDDPCKQL